MAFKFCHLSAHLANNPEYELKFTCDKARFYVPVNVATGYHTSRYVEVLNQQIYANAGATKETLQNVLEDMVLRCNKQQEKDTFRTDIAALANSLLYRLKYPVDQHCALRMGALLCFMEYDVIADEKLTTYTEDPDKCDIHWLQRKEQLALNNPDAYAFFLQMGISNTPAYREVFDTLNDSEYFLERERTINSLMPHLPT